MKRNIYSWINPKIEIKETEIYGKGVFAKQALKKDEFLIVMGGYIIDIEQENELDDFQIDKPIEISDDFAFSPMSPEDMESMPQHNINHSCNPNVGFKASNFIVAMRDIQPGEEIKFDYAMIIASNSKSKNYFKMDCLCGAPNCRKVIDEEGWKNPELQERYAGYFQWYIEEKIKKLKNS